MKLKNFVLILFSLSLILSNCSNDNSSMSNSVPLGNLKGVKEKTNLISKDRTASIFSKKQNSHELAKVEPMRLPYNWKRVGPLYEITFDHYEPVPGKIIGIWTPNMSIPWYDLHSKYGFRGISISAWQYELARQSGFEPKYMRIAISPISSDPNYYEYVVTNFYAGTYYTDEPLKHDCLGEWEYPAWRDYGTLMPQIKNFIHNKYGDSSKFVFSFYNDCAHVRDAIFTYNGADGITFSGYRNSISIEPSRECFIHPSEDQRDNWTDAKNIYSWRFFSVWVSAKPIDADDDIDEYNALLGHASNLGLKEVWLYCGLDGYNLGYITEFCDAAWKQGWLRKFIKVREYWIWYRCIENSPELCDPDDPSVWVFDHYEYGNVWIEEEFPK